MKEIINNENWRVFRVMAEFVESTEFMAEAGTSVTIFGSARTSEDNKYYKMAQKVASMFSEKGISIITGGGPGIMEAGNRGAQEGKNGQSIGLNIELPFEQSANPYIDREKDFHYFFIRKVMFIKYAKAIIIFPGGFGTMDEFFEALTLIQTRKSRKVPVILVGSEFWNPVVEILDQLMVKLGNISPEDMELFTVTDNPEEVVKIVEEHMNNTEHEISNNLER